MRITLCLQNISDDNPLMQFKWTINWENKSEHINIGFDRNVKFSKVVFFGMLSYLWKEKKKFGFATSHILTQYFCLLEYGPFYFFSNENFLLDIHKLVKSEAAYFKFQGESLL